MGQKEPDSRKSASEPHLNQYLFDIAAARRFPAFEWFGVFDAKAAGREFRVKSAAGAGSAPSSFRLVAAVVIGLAGTRFLYVHGTKGNGGLCRAVSDRRSSAEWSGSCFHRR